MATPRTVVTTSKMPNTKGTEKSERLVSAPVRLSRNVSGQSRKGLGKPR